MADLRIEWEGKSGKKYKYYIEEIESSFKAVPGNYIFSKEVEPHKWKPIYIGQTGDLSERFNNHHKKECIEKEDATHIHVHSSSEDEDVRKEEESDLIERWNPKPCQG